MYAYNADTYCDSCGARIAAELLAGDQPIVLADDSDHFPQYAEEEATDGPDHCASVGECLEPIDLTAYGLAEDAELYGAESRKIGALLSDGLTAEGVSYTLEMIGEEPRTPYQAALHRCWRESFPELADAEYDALETRARELGADHGRAAASWYFDGNTSEETYRAVLRGIEDGDPEILDSFPSGPLSGEYAGDPTPSSLADDLGIEREDDRLDDLCSAYEDGFYSASSEEIERVARYQLEPDTDDVFRAYLECALWASTDDAGEPLDDTFTLDDLADDARESMRADVVDFLALLTREGVNVSSLDASQIGHDFWLTRNRHGAGFWDRGLGELGETLTKLAHPYGESTLYAGDDGRLYVS